MSSLGFPCMHPDSSDYQNPEGYSVELVQQDDVLQITHRLQDAGSLPGQWIQEGLATFFCEVRAPYMLYCRNSACTQSPKLHKEGGLTVDQTVKCPDAQDKTLYFMPGIVLQDDRQVKLDEKTHGVSSIWHDRVVSGTKGTVLAGGNIFEGTDTIVNLLEFQRDENLTGDTCTVIRSEVTQDEDQWRLRVHVSAKTLNALRSEQFPEWNSAFFVGCLARMLDAIKEEFSDKKPTHEALKGLGKMVEDETSKSPPWVDEGDSWNDTLFIASTLYPLMTPQSE